MFIRFLKRRVLCLYHRKSLPHRTLQFQRRSHRHPCCQNRKNFVQQRREIAARYTAAINEAGLPLITQVIPDESASAFYKYAVVAGTQGERERLEKSLQTAHIETEHYYPCILPDQPVYRSGHLPCVVAGDLAVARHLAACGTCLPIYPELNGHEQKRVIEAVKQAFARHLYAVVAVAVGIEGS